MKLIKIKKVDSPRWNRKEYKFYILLPDGKIESGWPSKEDAKETYDELKEMGIKAKLVTLRTLQQTGIDPEDKTAWHAGDFNKFMRKGDFNAIKPRTIDEAKRWAALLEKRWHFIEYLCNVLQDCASRVNEATLDSKNDLAANIHSFKKQAAPLFKGILNAAARLKA